MKIIHLCVVPILALVVSCGKTGTFSYYPDLTGDVKPSEIVISEYVQAGEEGHFHLKPTPFRLAFDQNLIPADTEINNLNLSVYHFMDGTPIRIGNTLIDTSSDSVTFKYYYPGVYALLARTKAYGITEEGLFEDGQNPLLLIHGPLLSHQTWKTLKKELVKSSGGGHRITFEYPTNMDIFDSARLLSKELAEMHEQNGDFQLNVVTHSYGILVAMAYIGDTTLYHNDVERLLAVVPPYNGSHLVEKENIEELLRMANHSDLNVSDIAKSLTFVETLGEHSGLMEPDNEALNELYKSFYNNAAARQFGGRSDTNIEIEVIRGNKPFFDINSKAGDAPESPLAALYELREGTGDGLMDCNLNRKSRRISLMSMAPYPYNHLEIINKEDICKKIIEFLSLPKQFTTATMKNPSMEDYYKEADYEIQVHKWRNTNIDFIRSYNKNMLISMEQTAILFTNGDNDTYYALDLQNKEGFREDVAIINLSLLNTGKFIKMLKTRVPMTSKMTDDYIDKLSESHDKESLLEQVWDEQRTVSVEGENADSPKLTWNVPATLSYPVGKDSTTEYYIRVQDVMILDIIEANNWERPIYFAVTVTDKNLIGLRSIHDQSENFLTMEGMVFRLTPEPVDLISTDRLAQNMLHQFEYPYLNDTTAQFDESSVKLTGNYRQGLLQLAYHYLSEMAQTYATDSIKTEFNEAESGWTLEKRIENFEDLSDKLKGRTVLDFMGKTIPEDRFPIPYESIRSQIQQMYTYFGRSED